MKFYLKTRKHFLLSNTEMDCPERLRSLHQWRHWKPNRMWSWATSCSRPCVDRWHGLSGLQKFLPIFNNNNHRRSLYFQVYHLKIKHPRTKPEETGESISFYQYWQILASVIYQTIFPSPQFDSMLSWILTCYQRYSGFTVHVWRLGDCLCHPISMIFHYFSCKHNKYITSHPLRCVNDHYYATNTVSPIMINENWNKFLEESCILKWKWIFFLEEGNSIKMLKRVENATLWRHVDKANNMIVWCLLRA